MNEKGLIENQSPIILIAIFFIALCLIALFPTGLRDISQVVSGSFGGTYGSICCGPQTEIKDTLVRCESSSDCGDGFCCGGYLVDGFGTCRDETKYECRS